MHDVAQEIDGHVVGVLHQLHAQGAVRGRSSAEERDLVVRSRERSRVHDPMYLADHDGVRDLPSLLKLFPHLDAGRCGARVSNEHMVSTSTTWRA